MSAASEPVTLNQPLSGTRLRIVSAIVMIVPAIAAVYFGPPWFTALIIAAAIAMAWEWSRMCNRDPFWLVVGAIYIAVPCGILIWLRQDQQAGMITILWLFLLVWSADTGAYISGRAIGGPKLAPRISPNKTWAGFFGGVSLAGIVSGVFGYIWEGAFITLFLWGAVIAIASQAGDLIESAAKRHFNVKDSSSLIPGHGGVLDRVDALITASIAAALLKFTFGRTAVPWL